MLLRRALKGKSAPSDDVVSWAQKSKVMLIKPLRLPTLKKTQVFSSIHNVAIAALAA
ncbi:MAG: hypothetical protein AB4426_13945 [Xenococcaceae cyanobacterium]